MKKALLHCVSVKDLDSGNRTNHNKFYYMIQDDADSWHAEANRIGRDPIIYPRDGSKFPMHGGKNSWDSKYREKTQRVRNGYIYIDVTDYLTVPKTGDDKIIVPDIQDPLVAELIRKLSQYAKKSVASDYLVQAENVTQAQLSEAQNLIDEVSQLISSGSFNIGDLNQNLLQLYTIVPRRMDDVSDYLIADHWNNLTINNFIEEEQKRLDVMAQQVTEVNTDVEEGESILDAMGISIVKADDIVLAEVMEHIQEPSKVKNVYRVVNKRTQKRFDEFLNTIDKNRIKRWHGSYSKNWLGIITEGLVIRKSYTNGRAFGNGLYFGSFFKSLMYTDGGRYSNRSSGYMALYDLNMGNIYEIRESRGYWYSNIHEKLSRDGKQFHSVWAVAGGPVTYDEWIVYNQFGEQSTIYALVELG